MSAAKILLVEDNPSDVSLLRLALTETGEPFELHAFDDGQQAIEFFRSQRGVPQDLHPCVIVLDLNLPKRNGLEILQVIREDPAFGHIGVLVLTGLGTPREADELRRLGAHYRTKPNQLSELAELAAAVMALCKGIAVTL